MSLLIRFKSLNYHVYKKKTFIVYFYARVKSNSKNFKITYQIKRVKYFIQLADELNNA